MAGLSRSGRRAKRRDLSRKVRALVAAGLVFGVGASVTLAAWNDSEFSGATFSAGSFGIVGATNGVTFSEHATAATAATLAFSLPTGGLAPGNTIYALFSVRTINPSAAGTVQLTASAANNTGLGQWLTYGVNAITTTTCNASTFGAGAPVVTSGSPLTASPAAQQAVGANGANPVNYCFAITFAATAPNSAQGRTLTANWTFVATNS